jgi:hypothetical protein
MKKIFSFALLLSLITSVSNAQIKLNYNFDQNTNYSSSVVLKQGISQTIMGQTQDIDNDQGFGVTLTVNELDAESYNLKMLYNSIMINSPMIGLSYDSKTATTEPTGAAKAIAAIVGTEFNFQLNKDGSIENITGVEAMLDTMVANMEITDEAQIAAFKAQMSGQYNAETIKAQMKRTLIVYPDKELNKGDTWSADESVSLPFSMNIQTTYELTDYNDDTATINVSSDIVSEGGELTTGGATMTPDLSGVQSGTIIVDRKTGLILSMNMEQLITGVMNMTAPAEMEIPMEISGSSTAKGSIN